MRNVKRTKASILQMFEDEFFRRQAQEADRLLYKFDRLLKDAANDPSY